MDELHKMDHAIRGVIRQLNRIGLTTKSSCAGHDRPNTDRSSGYIDFARSSDMKEFLTIAQDHISPLKMRYQNILQFTTTDADLIALGLRLRHITQKQEGTFLPFETKTLESLLNISGATDNEGEMRTYLQNHLQKCGIDTWVDDAGNLLGERNYGRGTCILLSAHLDIYTELTPGSSLVKKDGLWTRSEGILGADDRAGIAIILNMLAHLNPNTFTGTIKLAFPVSEERGQRGAEKIDPTFFENVDCAISVDRKNARDIVYRSAYTEYAPKQYAEIFEQNSLDLWHGQYNFAPVVGGISDLRVWSQLGIPSVNLSIGYLNEHTTDEELHLDEWQRTNELLLYTLTKMAYHYNLDHKS